MTDKEILAELKKSYDYITDILENGNEEHCNGQIKIELANKLELAKNNIEEVYFDFYKTLHREDLCVDSKEEKNTKVYIARTIDGDYEIEEKQENGIEEYSITCEDLDYYWQDDEDFLLEGKNE